VSIEKRRQSIAKEEKSSRWWARRQKVREPRNRTPQTDAATRKRERLLQVSEPVNASDEEQSMPPASNTMPADDDIAVFKEQHLCIVHKGPVDNFTFICPKCGTFYCKTCFDVVVAENNACWACGRPLDSSRPSKPLPIKHQDDDGKGKKPKTIQSRHP
jgi:hypothetical protein